jgi:peptidoglycan/xylan/chitin deacetylase (PgdA/CDA1 family)
MSTASDPLPGNGTQRDGGGMGVTSDGASWTPAPLAHITFWVYAGTALTVIAAPALWPWAVAVLMANHLVLFVAVMLPRSRMLGPNITHLSEAAVRRGEVALTFDDGPDPDVTPRVLDLLDRHGAKASFFCVGERAAAHPDLVREIVRRGHSVENHSYRHSNFFAFYGLMRFRKEVAAAQQTLSDIAGRAPVFFRAPMGFRSPLLDPVMWRAGLRYVSWTRRGFDAVSGNPARVLRRLCRNLAAGDILLLHDGSAARTATGEAVVLAVLPGLLDHLSELGLHGVSLAKACEDGSAL